MCFGLSEAVKSQRFHELSANANAHFMTRRLQKRPEKNSRKHSQVSANAAFATDINQDARSLLISLMSSAFEQSAIMRIFSDVQVGRACVRARARARAATGCESFAEKTYLSRQGALITTAIPGPTTTLRLRPQNTLTMLMKTSLEQGEEGVMRS